MTARGFFITFEGVEGSGKTTQIEQASKFLNAHGIFHLVTAEPGGTPLGKAVRRMVLYDFSLELCPEAELLLFCAARAQHVRQVILPALNQGTWVLCDRFTDATLAYQYHGRGLAPASVAEISRFAAFGLRPDRTFLFDLPVALGLTRARRETAAQEQEAREDRIEALDISFHERVRAGYLKLAEAEPERFIVIDAAREINFVAGDVFHHLQGLIGRRL